MSSGIDESDKKLTEELKKLMKSSDWPENVVAEIEKKHHLQLPPALLQQLGKANTNTQDRRQVMRRFAGALKEKTIKEDQVERLWLELEDVLCPPCEDMETLHAALALFTAVAVTANASKRFGAPMRHIVHDYVSKQCSRVAIEPLFDLFSGALGEGKVLELVEDLVGPFLNTWYPQLLKSQRAEAAIELFINLTKTNAAFLDEPELLGLVKHTVIHINTTMSEREGLLGVRALETVVAYCHLPSVTVESVLCTLARVVSSPAHHEKAWKLMRTILGTYLGVSAYHTLCSIVKSGDTRDPHIVRGCVYFLHMTQWGSTPIASLDVPYHFALPVLRKASEHRNELVVYEVSFAMKLLVAKLGPEIHPQAWDNVFAIITNIFKFSISMVDNVKAQAILNVVNDTVDYMEQLRDQDQFCVLRETFYTFLSPFTLLRTESSTIKVLEYLVTSCLESRTEEGWLERLGKLLRQYYIRDSRQTVRMAAVALMKHCHQQLGKKQATELIENIILPAVHNYRSEPLDVRCAVVDLLGYIVHSHNHPIITECLHLLLLTVTDPFKQAHGAVTSELTCSEAADVGKAVTWLIKVFKRRMWHLPSSDAITAFRSLLTFLENHYANPDLFRAMGDTRAEIFEMIFYLRANSEFMIGMPDVDDAQLPCESGPIPGINPVHRLQYSPYIIIDHKHGLTMANAASTASNSPAETIRTMVQSVASSPGTDSADNVTPQFIRQYSGTTKTVGVASPLTGVYQFTPKVESIATNLPKDTINVSPVGVSSSSEQTSSSQQQQKITSADANISNRLSATTEQLSAVGAANEGTTSAATATTSQNNPDVSSHSSFEGKLPDSLGNTLPEMTDEESEKAIDDYIANLNDKDYYGIDGRAPPLPRTNDPWREAQRHAAVTYLSLTEAAATVIVALKRERDWRILKMILEGIPKMLQNKALIVSRDSNDIDYFADALTSAISDRLPLNTLYNTPEKFLQPDYEHYVFLALSCLSCYRKQLSPKWQNAVVLSLTNGMRSKCGGVCIAALTLCCLEMPHTMVRSLPNILHALTKMSATVHSSQPVLEFLSTLLHLPHIYSNFSSEQYMAVFAIVIPFTNPVKFNQYVVILAFHVLAMWFLKCKISSRRNFVNFITKNLKNVLGPVDLQPRRRSAGLGEQPPGSDRAEIYAKLHKDMCMILTDLMSRYAFASCAPMARRSEVGEALVGSGQQQTWLVGLKLFTITTSGCSQRPMTQDGLCENCHATCTALIQAEDPALKKKTKDSNTTSNVSEREVTVSSVTSDLDNVFGPPDMSRHVSRDGQQFHASQDDRKPSVRDRHKSAKEGHDISKDSQDEVKDGQAAIKDGQAAIKDCHLCTCWCVGYSEVYVRQPTGNMVWMMRLQNHQQILEEGKHMSLDDLATLYGPSITPKMGQLGEVLSQMLKYPEPVESVPPALGRRRSSSSVVAGDAELRRPALLTDTTVGGPATHSLREEEDALEQRIAVQRSQSNPEIGDGDEPHGAGAAGANTSTSQATSSRNTSDANPRSPPAQLPAQSPLSSVSPAKQHVNTPVPQSPSKLSFRFSKLNSNINKFFGNPSSSSSGSTSPTMADISDVTDTRRMRHTSALAPSNTSSSQPNVSAHGAVGTSSERLTGSQDAADCDSLPPVRRGRGHTISVMNPASRPLPPTLGTPLSPLSSPPNVSQPRLLEIFSKPWSRPQPGTTTYTAKKNTTTKERRGGVTPSNVLLQLLYAGNLEKSFERPLLIPQEDVFTRTIDVLDHTPPVESHRIGLLYVGEAQTTETEILGNKTGSIRYQNFLRGIGTVVSLKKASKGFVHCLSDKGDDGDDCYVWQDEIMQVLFHVATIMPHDPPRHVSKKRHIGNDFVTIVYNDSGKPYNRDTIKTQFNTVIVEIRPTDHETNTVHMSLKPQIQDLLSSSPVVRIVSDANLALYARQMALHSVIACCVQQQLQHPEPYAGNWLRRLRSTYGLRQRLLDRLQQMDENETTDFTDMLEKR